jgi:hypothetical protein
MGEADGMFTGDLQRRLTEVERQLRNLTSGRSLEDASIGARGLRLLQGGSLTVFGGAIRMTDETGSVGLLYFGPSSAGQPVWLFSFDDGEIAGGLFGTPGSTYWSWRDRSQNEVFAVDGQTGVGLSRPYVPLMLVPSSEAQTFGTSFWPSHTSTSFVRLMGARHPIFHPKIEIGVGATTAGGGTAEWRLLINDIDVTGTVAGSATKIAEIPGWGDTIKPGHVVEFKLQARIAGGGANVLVQCDKLFARQS